MNFGGYNNDQVNRFIDLATTAASAAEAEGLWKQATEKITSDVAILPLISTKYPAYRSSRTRNCVTAVFGLNCYLSAVWLKGAKP
jgi:peptide/nickel transport system substrate-binding protein